MADLYPGTKKPISLYKDRRFLGDQREREMQLRRSTTLYVGNLSFYTNEEQVFELFSKAGEIKRIIMGLDRKKKTPCGFCFVEYFTRAAADNSVHFISGSKLDERVIRVDYDAGFEPGRQFGRGRSGGQVRDEYRTDYDPGRGGYGKATGGQTGMSGMQLWGENESLPNGGRFNGPRRGRGRGRRGRSYGGRGGGRYGGGRYEYDGPRGRAPKRYRDYEDDGRYERSRDDDDGGGGGGGGGGYRDTKARRMDEGESERGFGGTEGRDGEVAQDERADDEEQTHNARFERGRQNEFEEEM